MKPKKILIERAKANGAIDRMNILFSGIQILNAEANKLADECSEILAENGLLMGRLKQLHTNFVKAADNYFQEFAACVFDEKSKMDMFGDIDSFDNVFRQWSRIEKDWKPKSLDYGNQSIHDNPR